MPVEHDVEARAHWSTNVLGIPTDVHVEFPEEYDLECRCGSGLRGVHGMRHREYHGEQRQQRRIEKTHFVVRENTVLSPWSHSLISLYPNYAQTPATTQGAA